MNLSELKKLLTLCRKHGVTDIDLDGTKIKFGELPVQKPGSDGEDDDEKDELTPEQLMFYSVGGP